MRAHIYPQEAHTTAFLRIMRGDDALVVKEQSTCETCDGDGLAICDRCEGEGVRDCTCMDCGDEHEVKCRTCKGSGRLSTPCPDCKGKKMTGKEVKPVDALHPADVYTLRDLGLLPATD
jgi:DnaJ-class molecular chaperone